MFSKSKRFEDSKKVLTPGPGQYDLKHPKAAPLSSFPKGPRFQDSSDNESVGSTSKDFSSAKPEFKAPKRVKRKQWKKVASVQTDIMAANAEDPHMVNELRTRATTLQNEVATLADCTSELQGRLTQNENQLDSVQSRLQEELSTVSQLKSQLASAQAQLEKDSDLKQEIVTIRNELSKSSELSTSLESELSTLKGRLEVEKENMCRLEAELNKQESNHQTVRDELIEQMQSLSTTKDTLEAEIQTLTQTLQLRKDSISSLTTSLERETQLKAATEATSKNKDETISCLKTTITQLERAISEWEGIHADSTHRQHQLEQQVTSTSTSLEALAEQLASLKLANDKTMTENEQLQSSNQSSRDKIEELQSLIEKLKEEKIELVKKFELAKSLQGVVKQKEGKIEELLDLNNLMSAKLDDLKSVKHQLAGMEDIISGLMKKEKEHTAKYEVQLADARTKVKELEVKNVDLAEEVKQQQARTEALTEQYSTNIVSLQTQLASANQHVKDSEDRLAQLTSSLREERDAALLKADKVQKLYKELEDKIAPFKEQLDAFDLEKKLLEGQSRNWASEAAKATQECAKLLGHQNQRQKIRRINQISEENLQLKQEIMTLRSSESKLRKQLLQHQVRRKFDPSKAFQHGDEENQDRTPLKTFNSADA